MAAENVVAEGTEAAVVAPAAEATPEQKAAAIKAAADAVAAVAEVEAAEVAEPEREPVPELGYELEVPADVPGASYDERSEELLGEFGAVAAGSGLSQTVAQDLVEAFTQAHSALGVNNLYEGTPEDAANVLRGYFGERYEEALATIRANADALGEKFKDWLDESNLGNDPRALIALAHAGDLVLSQAKAQEQIEALMKTEAYKKGNKAVIARIGNLMRIAGREQKSPEQQLAEVAKTRVAPTPEPRVQTGATSSAPVREVVQKMLSDKSGALMNANHPDHAKAVQQWHSLVAKL